MNRPDYEFRGPMRWNVAFERRRTVWGHVLAFAPAGDHWVVIDPHLTFTEVYTLGPDEFDAWITDLTRHATVWRIDGDRRAPLLAGLWCVGTVKRLLGLRSGALSPEGLKRDLLRAGAVQVFTRESQNPQGRPANQVGA